MSRLWQISAAAKPIAIALQHPMPCKTKPKTLGFELLTTYKWSNNLYKWPQIIGQLVILRFFGPTLYPATGRSWVNGCLATRRKSPSSGWRADAFGPLNPWAIFSSESDCQGFFVVKTVETDPQLTKDDSTGFNFVIIFALYLYFH